MATNTIFRRVPPSGMRPTKNNIFDAQVFLESVGASRKAAEFEKNKPSSLRARPQIASCTSRKGA
jgi:hypothetical protein